MKQESPNLPTDLGEAPQFPLKRPRDSSAEDPDAEAKRLKVDNGNADLDPLFDMDELIRGVMMNVNDELGKVDGLDVMPDVDISPDALASFSQEPPPIDAHSPVLPGLLATMRRSTISCLSNFVRGGLVSPEGTANAFPVCRPCSS